MEVSTLRAGVDFNPRPPQGGRPAVFPVTVAGQEFQSTPSARRATYERPCTQKRLKITIHALRKEGDSCTPRVLAQICEFQSTPSARRATIAAAGFDLVVLISIHALRKEGDVGGSPKSQHMYDFNPRPPQGGRLAVGIDHIGQLRISIHALRKEGDWTHQNASSYSCISIHALRKEGDRRPRTCAVQSQNFNPRPPQGGRPCTPSVLAQICKFQSTPSARRATAGAVLGHAAHDISIHALRKEGDVLAEEILPLVLIFQSTPSARRATSLGCGRKDRVPISIHALRKEGDNDAGDGRCRRRISIHALRKEGDIYVICAVSIVIKFQSTPSARRATWRVVSVVITGCNFNPRPPQGGRLSGLDMSWA